MAGPCLAKVFTMKDGMNTENPFYAFIALVATDDKLRQAYRQQENLSGALEKLTLEYENKQRDLQALQVRQHELKKQLHAQELELQLSQDRVRTKRHKLDQIASPREYLSMQNELVELEKVVTREQETVLLAMEELEKISPQLEQEQINLDQLRAASELKRSEIKSEQERVAAAIEHLDVQRKEQEKTVYAPLLEQYQAMKDKVANPAVPVINGACGGCFYIVTTQELNLLKRHKIVHCAQCYRLLYILE